MRLSCPNCAAEYEVAAGLVPAGGRHVQCTACHTRWFAQPDPEAAREDEAIIHRLEARGPRAVSPVAPVAAVPEALGAEAGFRWEHAGAPDGEAAVAVAGDRDGPAEAAGDGALASASVVTLHPARGRREEAGPAVTGPALTPQVAEPGSGPGPEAPSAVEVEAAREEAAAESEPPAPSGRSRLDLTQEPETAGSLPAPPSRFGHGLAVAVACLAVAVAAYVLRAPIAATVPAAAPVLDAYSGFVDELRESVDDLLPGGDGGA